MMNWIRIKILVPCLFIGIWINAQETLPRNDVKDNRAEAFAFLNGTIIVDDETTIDKGVLIIKNGKIESVGKDLPIPKGYQIVDASGMHIYPSLIDIHTNYGLAKPSRAPGSGFNSAEQIQSKTKGAYNANEAIKASYNAVSNFTIDNKLAGDMRQAGFGTVLTFREDGIARGSSALVTLGEDSDNNVVIRETAAAHYSFNRGTSTQYYPRSMMGYIALLRQTYLDCEWFQEQQPRPFTDKDLDAWIQLQKLPQIFDAGSWMNILRADKIGDEFGVQYITKGNGDSYKRIKEIKNTGASLIVPVNFPKSYDVDDPLDALRVSYADMLHWELAPTNPGVLEANEINFALTSAGLNNKKDFKANIQKAIKHGLSEKMALKALTSVPAGFLGVSDQVGSLKQGMIANFIITNGPVFGEKTTVYENWIQGKPFRYKDLAIPDYAGQYAMTIGTQKYQLEISGEPSKQKARIKNADSTFIDVKVKFSNDLISMNFNPAKKDPANIRISGWTMDQGWMGRGQLDDGTWVDWQAKRTGDLEKKPDRNKPEQNVKNQKMGDVVFPFIAYGIPAPPKQETLLIKNATVWTNEKQGILKNTDVLLRDGKIARIGKNISPRNAKVIDGTNKHLTSGIIDEHTHIGGGGNDVATNSSMVRIGDQVNSEDINLYRSLAGGVTAAQVLHGSANPIGGQSALIKLRWGAAPEELKIAGADEFIKFALGENVKRSSSRTSQRYPQTRMGVEQVYVDAFTNALEYEKKWNTFNSLPNDKKAKARKPRRDLANEAMLEIINKERFITCHSYVQSEINMLMKVAERFNFNVNTFTHILEGYKVADKMKKHGVGGSTFSDWWNYKWEVRYAIPYNAAIMHNEGVVTAINSDDANMGRRLNQEAAKAIKYGNLDQEDAWKMVTLNPAKLLHLDDRMGSIKVDKDADVVLWSDHPLSVYARAEKTIVDGKIYFDLDEDQVRREMLQKERARLIQKMIGEKKAGQPTQPATSKINIEMHCADVLGEALSEHIH